MPTTIYRADSRPAADVDAPGFTARQAGYDLDGARNVARRLMDPTHALVLPDGAAPGLFDAIAKSPTGNVSLADMVRVAKAEKSINTIHVSTDYTEACGGYANGADGSGRRNLNYRIDVPDDNYVFFKQQGGNGRLPVVPTQANTIAAPGAGAVNPVLIMNNPDPMQATFIAIASSGDELTFLTAVPPQWVRQFRTQDPAQAGGFSPWTDMPHVQAQALGGQAQVQAQAPVQPVQAPVQPVPQPPLQAPVQPVQAPVQVQGPQPQPQPQPVQAPPLPQAPVQAPPPLPQAPLGGGGGGGHPYQDPQHQHHGLYTQATRALEALPANRFNADALAVTTHAVGMVHAAQRKGMDSIGEAAVNGTSLFVIQGGRPIESADRCFVQTKDMTQAPAPLQAPQDAPQQDHAQVRGSGGPKLA